MSEFITLPVRFCKPGFILVEDVVAPSTHAVLVPKNTVMTEKILGRLLLSEVKMVRVIKSHATKKIHDDLNIKKDVKQLEAEQELGYDNMKAMMLEAVVDMTVKGELDDSMVKACASQLAENSSEDKMRSVFECVDGLRSVNEYLYTHSVNVALLSAILGRWLNFSKEQIDDVLMAGLLHDMGKVKIPEGILDKPGALTSKEFEVVKKHPVYSVELMSNLEGANETVKDAILKHHERLNGSGYPNGVEAADIGPIPRILAITDTYDGVVAAKVYRDKQTQFEVFNVFSRDKYSGLDIHMVNVFLDKMAGEYIGESVRLNDGRVGKIVFINPVNYARPMLEVDGDAVSLAENEELEIVEVLKGLS